MTRYSIHGHELMGFLDAKCFDCGMPLVSADEFHPYEACEVFRRTHASREVEKAIGPLFRAHIAGTSHSHESP